MRVQDEAGINGNLHQVTPPHDGPARHLTDRLALGVGIAAAAYFILHCVLVIAGSERGLMAWLYDDSLYYAIIAKHFSAEHLSSFDGVTVTTGYHPLWMWLCSLVYGLRNRLDLTYLRLCMALSATITSLVILFALRTASRRQSTGWLWALALAVTSYSAFNNGLTIMEWPLVVMFWMALHVRLLRNFDVLDGAGAGSKWVSLAILFLLGLGGSISRTDFGLIPLAYLFAGLVVALRSKNIRPAQSAASALVGAVVGLGVVFSYNYRMTGVWLQQSAQVKHAFAQLAAPFNPVPALWQFGRALFYLPPLDIDPHQRSLALKFGAVLILIIAVPLCLLVIRYRRPLMLYSQRALSESPLATFELVSATVGVFGYLVVYAFNSQATYGWYTATVTGFIVILAARLLSAIPKRVSAIVVMPLIFLNVLGSLHGGNARAQYLENEAGILMHHDHPHAVMGGGDVGKSSFYNNGEMINLDGLVNNEVVPYLLSGHFPCYMLQRRIEYIYDVGTITLPLTDAVRKKENKSPVPWDVYFTPVDGHNPDGDPAEYLHTNFDAIRQSGECGDAK